MIFRNLILSSEKKFVAFRHLLFWLVYATLFHIQNNDRTLFYIGCFLPACVAIVYALLYVVLPLLHNKRHSAALAVAIAVYVTSLLLNFIGSYIFFAKWDDEIPNRIIIGLALHNHIIALCMGGVAFGLKATKSWYLKQIENLVLAKQKAQNELRLEKANLYPEFILQALTCLQDRVVKGTIDSPDLLLKLSDTLSYILYESQVELILMEKELAMVRNIITFRTLQWPSCNIQFVITGTSTDCHVAPLSLFRIVENFFRVVGVDTVVTTDVDIRISIEDDHLKVNMLVQYSRDRLDEQAFANIINKMKKRGDTNFNQDGVEVENSRAKYSVSAVLDLTKKSAHLNDIPAKENVLA